MSIELITSTKNEYVKMVRGLRQKKNRTRLLLAEGEKCVAEALRHARVECVIADDEADPVFAAAGARGASRLLVSRAVMEAISDAKTPQHVCAAVCIEKKELPLQVQEISHMKAGAENYMKSLKKKKAVFIS